MSTTAVWNNFSNHLYNFILQKVNSSTLADDILQDVFLKVHKNRNQLKEEEKLESWLFRITRNTITDHYRKTQKEVKLENELTHLKMDHSEFQDLKNLDFLADVFQQRLKEFQNENDSKIENTEEAIFFFKTICPFMEEIDSKYAEAVFWVDWQGISQKEFAEKLGISLSGAKSRVQRGRAHIKSLFTQCCEFEYDSRGQVIDFQKRPSSPCKKC